jgi:hypothetical protein
MSSSSGNTPGGSNGNGNASINKTLVSLAIPKLSMTASKKSTTTTTNPTSTDGRGGRLSRQDERSEVDGGGDGSDADSLLSIPEGNGSMTAVTSQQSTGSSMFRNAMENAEAAGSKNSKSGREGSAEAEPSSTTGDGAGDNKRKSRSVAMKRTNPIPSTVQPAKRRVESSPVSIKSTSAVVAVDEVDLEPMADKKSIQGSPEKKSIQGSPEKKSIEESPEKKSIQGSPEKTGRRNPKRRDVCSSERDDDSMLSERSRRSSGRSSSKRSRTEGKYVDDGQQPCSSKSMTETKSKSSTKKDDKTILAKYEHLLQGRQATVKLNRMGDCDIAMMNKASKNSRIVKPESPAKKTQSSPTKSSSKKHLSGPGPKSRQTKSPSPDSDFLELGKVEFPEFEELDKKAEEQPMLLEVCVDNLRSALNAAKGGAGR